MVLIGPIAGEQDVADTAWDHLLENEKKMLRLVLSTYKTHYDYYSQFIAYPCILLVEPYISLGFGELGYLTSFSTVVHCMP